MSQNTTIFTNKLPPVYKIILVNYLSVKLKMYLMLIINCLDHIVCVNQFVKKNIICN